MLITPAQTLSESVDDVPLILQWPKQIDIASIIDQKPMPAHKKRTGLSYGHWRHLSISSGTERWK